jgi:hypothetical protein
MKKFVDTYDLTRLPVLDRLRARVTVAHADVQKLEGVGWMVTEPLMNTRATVSFLGVLGATLGDISPSVGPRQSLLTEVQLLSVLTKSLPKFNCDMIKGQTFKGHGPVWQCGVRQGGYSAQPLASGFAVSSNATVALMQATLRCLDALITQKQVVALRMQRDALKTVKLDEYDRARLNWGHVRAQVDDLFKRLPGALSP